ncbi:MAG: PspC domain-containing protein [Planctomycetes bacterium]|nr:PspC domain-containing protein [Planctomycetota bacterium]
MKRREDEGTEMKTQADTGTVVDAGKVAEALAMGAGPSVEATSRWQSTEPLLGGVCGRIAERMGWPAFRVRYLAVALCLLTGLLPGLVVYMVLSFVMRTRS